MANKKYTEEMLSYIREYSPSIPRKELLIMFNEKFNMNISHDALNWVCKSNGIKGIKNFYKGCECPHKNTKYKVGDEFFIAGEWRVLTSTEEGVPILQRSEYKKRILWEKAYGEVPENHCFIYLDGDKRNCELENLACVPLIWMRIMTKNGWIKGEKEITLSAIKWCELHYSLSQKVGNRYVKMNGSRYR